MTGSTSGVAKGEINAILLLISHTPFHSSTPEKNIRRNFTANKIKLEYSMLKLGPNDILLGDKKINFIST